MRVDLALPGSTSPDAWRNEVKLDSAAFVADRELIEALETRSKPIQCKEDCVLFAQGDSPSGLYILRDGGARLSMTSATGDMIMSVPVSTRILARFARAHW